MPQGERLDGSRRRIAAIWSNELRAYRRDQQVIVILVLLPLVLIALFRRTFKLVLEMRGYHGASGAEHVVPGMSVTFGFFIVGFTGLTFVREHVWGTWDRLLAAGVRPAELLVGKCVPPLAVATAQQIVLFGAGAAFFDLPLGRPAAAVAVVSVAFSLFLIGFALLLVAVCHSVQQLTAVATLAAMVFSGIGGGMVPEQLLPSWARALAPLTPTSWAMRGYRSVLLDGSGFGAVLVPVVVLLAASAVGLVVGARRIRAAALTSI